MFHPSANEEIIPQYKAAIPTPCPHVNIADNARTFDNTNGLLSMWFIGRFIPDLGIKLDNFNYATRDPVNVIPPMNVPNYDAIKCKLLGCGSIMNELKHENTAAMPTKLWKIATV